ncbi:hypothetical protein [Streptomyces smyrnaeus]|uniref:hypothetical protein n=1 Tax=Streptomyces smyrnaeus TaxID=1387713 RepID=UPI00117D2880
MEETAVPAQDPAWTRRVLARLEALPGDKTLQASEISELLEYKDRNQVNSYLKHRPGYFPEPDRVEVMGGEKRTYRRRYWFPATIIGFVKEGRPGRGRRRLKDAQWSDRVRERFEALPQDEMVSAGALSRLLEYAGSHAVTTYVRRGSMPEPDKINEVRGEESYWWYPDTVRPFVEGLIRAQDQLVSQTADTLRSERKRDAVAGQAKEASLPTVSRGGDPEEMLYPSQVAALLGYKHLKSFASALAQGHRRLEPLQGTWTKVKAPQGGPAVRTWPRRIVESIE